MVYLVTTESFPNGMAASQRLRGYAKGLAQLGERCEVLCVNRLEDPAAPLGNAEPRGELEGYAFRYLGGSTRRPSGDLARVLVRLADTRRLGSFLFTRARRSDKVIVYSYSPALLKLVRQLSALVGFEAYLELNEHPSIFFRGEDPGDLSGFEGILCISTALQRLVVEGGVPAARVHLVNMLVDPARFEGLEKRPGAPYIAYCGAADNAKDGVDRLIRAFAAVAPKYPSHRLRVMGPLHPELGNERLAAELGVGDRVDFMGLVDAKQLPQLLVDADALALARPRSLQAEYGFPTKLGEYLLSGNPVVVTAVGDIPRFLADGESALLAAPDDDAAFAAKLDAALGRADAAAVGARGRRVALDAFSLARVAQQLKEALQL